MSVVSGIVGSNAVKSAANTSAAALKDTTTQQLEMSQNIYDQTMRDQAPYQQVGNSALPYLQSAVLGGKRSVQVYKQGPDGKPLKDDQGNFVMETLSGEFNPEESPAAKWQMQQGTKSLNRQLAARGLLGGGNAANRLSELQQNINATDYNTQYGRLLDLVAKGAGANASTQSAGANYANNGSSALGSLGQGLSNAALQSGQAQASLYSGMSSNAINGAALGFKAYNAYNNYNNVGGTGLSASQVEMANSPPISAMTTN